MLKTYKITNHGNIPVKNIADLNSVIKARLTCD
jgi:hypothetical protein